MKKILAILLSLLTLLSCGLLSACSAEKTQPDTLDTETVWETVSEAYIYAFPLVLTDATKTLSTNTDGTMTGRAPINQFNHVKKLADASFRTVVTPNVDTVYSQAWLDISTEPMVYVLPETDRFCNVQLLDAWTNTAAVLDKAGAYAIALPGWEGELPDGVTRVDVPPQRCGRSPHGAVRERGSAQCLCHSGADAAPASFGLCTGRRVYRTAGSL